MRRRHAIALAGAGFALLVVAWVFASPPFRGPDEGAQYLRAVDISEGKLLGPKVPYIGATPAMTTWIQHDNRGVFVPARLSPPTMPCEDGRPKTGRPGCLEPTYTSDYLPLPYLLTAVGIKVSHGVDTAIWLGRLGSALPCVAFLLLAFALLWAGSVWSVLGLFAAVTPMTLFIASVINASGLEIAGNLAFVAALLRISRQPRKVPSWVWAATATSGAASILAYQLGWAYLAAQVAALVFILDIADMRTLVRAHLKAIGITTAVIVVAGGIYVAYGKWSGLIHGTVNIHPFLSSLQGGLQQLGSVLPDTVGNFGPLVVPLPRASQWVWWILVLGLCAGALARSQPRGRVTMLIATAVAVAFPVLFFAWVLRLSGFPLQARYAMPVLALGPLLAGELLFRAQRPVGARFGVLGASMLGLIAGLHVYAWWFNARASAGRPHAYWFLAAAHWNPPLGWIPWTAAALLGAGALVALAAVDVLSARMPGRTGTTALEAASVRPVARVG